MVFDVPSVAGKPEAQHAGVKEVAAKPYVSRTVHAVACKRMPQRGEVYPNLVRPARLRLGLHECVSGQPLQDAEGRLCVAATLHHCHTLAVPRVPTDGGFHGTLGWLQPPFHQGRVYLTDRPLLELPCDVVVRPAALGDHHKP